MDLSELSPVSNVALEVPVWTVASTHALSSKSSNEQDADEQVVQMDRLHVPRSHLLRDSLVTLSVELNSQIASSTSPPSEAAKLSPVMVTMQPRRNTVERMMIVLEQQETALVMATTPVITEQKTQIMSLGESPPLLADHARAGAGWVRQRRRDNYPEIRPDNAVAVGNQSASLARRMW